MPIAGKGIYGGGSALKSRIVSLEDTYVKSLFFEQVDSGTSGTVSPPVTGATFVLDQWSSGVDALASEMADGQPTFESPRNAGGTVITATFNAGGEYTLSDTPASYPVAVVYVYRCQFKYYDDTKTIAESELDEISADDVYLDLIGSPTYTSLEDFINTTSSAGYVSGGTITDHGDGSVDVSAMRGYIRTSENDVASLKPFDLSAQTSVSLTNNSVNYLYVDYNTSTGVVSLQATTTRTDIKWNTEFIIGKINRSGTALSIVQGGIYLPNMARGHHERLVYRGIERASGGVISEPATLYLASTAGTFYIGSNKITTVVQNTQTGGNTFSYWYYDGAWNEVTGQTQIDNTYYNNTATGLVELTANRYGVHWIYICLDSKIHVVYGNGDYTLAQAEEVGTPPSTPSCVSELAIVVSKAIVQKSGASLYALYDYKQRIFATSSPTSHNDLAGLQGGTTDEYYHLTSAQHSALHASGSDTTLGAMTADINMNTHQLTSLSVPDAAGEAIRQTAKITEANLEADHDKLAGIEASADVTDATNVDAAGAVMESDFNATTFLYATDDNTPQPKTPAETMGILSGQASADFSMNTHKITSVTDPTADQDAATKKYVDDNAGGGGGGLSNLIINPFAVCSQADTTPTVFGSDLVTDGDMESDPTSNWTASGLSIAVETGTVHAGTNSLKLTRTAADQYAYQAISPVEGKLYKATAWAYIPTAGGVPDARLRIGTGITSTDAYDIGQDEFSTKDTWGELTVYFSTSESTIYCNLFAAGNGYIYFDDVSIKEVSPCFTGADNKCFDGGWLKSTSDIDVYRETDVFGQEYYGARCVITVDGKAMYYIPQNYERYRSTEVVFGSKVKTSTASRVRVYIYDDVTGYTYSSYHTGGGTEEWLEATATVSASATSFSVGYMFSGTTGDVYVGCPMFCFGDSIGEGSYQPPFDKTVPLDTYINSPSYHDIAGQSSLGATLFSVVGETLGKFPPTITRCSILIICRDSGSASGTAYLRILDIDQEVTYLYHNLRGIANDRPHALVHDLRLDDYGFGKITWNASGSGTFDIDAFIFQDKVVLQ